MSTYPKSSDRSSYRSSKPRKRRFYGKKSNEERDKSAKESASTRKLASASSDDVPWNRLHGYRLIEFFTVFTTLSDLVICRECKKTVKFEEAGNRSLGFKLVLMCQCGRRDINSSPLINTGFEVNRRIVFVMRLLGVGMDGLNLFCNLMDLCEGLRESSYNNIVNHIYETTKSIFELCSKKAVEEEKKENEKQERPILNLKVSGDGSWKKRGFKSLYGVTTLIGYYSGKVIDLVVKSSYCQASTYWKNKKGTEKYNEWFEEHEEECLKNHEASAGKMEVASIIEMFLASEEKFGVKYENYIGDGDSKTFKAILDVNPYGEDFTVIKNECISHVAKRMGTRLRNVKKEHKLGGKGKLTDSLIKKLTTYYSLAIRRNINSVEDMKKGILSTYYHMCSTGKNSRHEYCPLGADSWCEWKKAEATGVNPKLLKHPTPLQTYKDTFCRFMKVYRMKSYCRDV